MLPYQDVLEFHTVIRAYLEGCCAKKKKEENKYVARIKNIWEIYVTADSNPQKTLLLTIVTLWGPHRLIPQFTFKSRSIQIPNSELIESSLHR